MNKNPTVKPIISKAKGFKYWICTLETKHHIIHGSGITPKEAYISWKKSREVISIKILKEINEALKKL